MLYSRAEEPPLLRDIAGQPEYLEGLDGARIAAVDEEFNVLPATGRLGLGRFVAVNQAGIVCLIEVRHSPRSATHEWLTRKEEVGYTAEDYALCAASRHEITISLMTPVPAPGACSCVLFQTALIDRLAILAEAVVYDHEASRFTSPVRRRVPDATWPLDVREHIGFQVVGEGKDVCVRTRGMVKFACAEVQAERVPRQNETIQLVIAALSDLAQQMATGARPSAPDTTADFEEEFVEIPLRAN